MKCKRRRWPLCRQPNKRQWQTATAATTKTWKNINKQRSGERNHTPLHNNKRPQNATCQYATTGDGQINHSPSSIGTRIRWRWMLRIRPLDRRWLPPHCSPLTGCTGRQHFYLWPRRCIGNNYQYFIAVLVVVVALQPASTAYWPCLHLASILTRSMYGLCRSNVATSHRGSPFMSSPAAVLVIGARWGLERFMLVLSIYM